MRVCLRRDAREANQVRCQASQERSMTFLQPKMSWILGSEPRSLEFHTSARGSSHSLSTQAIIKNIPVRPGCDGTEKVSYVLPWHRFDAMHQRPFNNGALL